ncbi:TonB-dependent receptor [Luteimonas fraxinea]|nr:TonB-dependent receptor [Luteimonas fraxinea]UHH09147.1 TonB-dependent receptor [Luteimonas fraxinea]
MARVQGSDATELDAVTVTGTRIRGGNTPSPVITLGSERIREEGFSDLGEVIRSVPQNFSGGQNPGVLSGNISGAGNANQNMTGGSGLNLRGLGADATLTLLNGRRMAYGGFTQSVDISAIPVEAVERIEIVADGASAIYGSDAVGGVGNVVLKRDYDGVGIGARLGAATQGGLSTREYTVTTGATWSGGGMIATYKDASVDPIYSDRRGYTEQLVDPSTLYPGSDLRSGLLSAHQSLGDAVELRVDALRTERDQLHHYNWAGRHSVVTPHTMTTLVAPSAEVWLPNDWSLSVSGAFGRGTHDQVRRETITTTGVTSISDVCYCNESRSHEIGAEGPLFALPAGDARVATGLGQRRNTFRSTNHVTGINTVDGSESARFAYAEIDVPLVAPAQGRAGIERLSVTAAARAEDYSSFGQVTTPKLGLIYGPSPDMTLKASWGRSFKAPTLFERYASADAWLYHPSSFGGTGYAADAAVLAVTGGNRDLDPERATTRSVSLAWHPSALPGLEAELTWFQVAYTSRVIQPIANPTQALSSALYAPFVDLSPPLTAQQALLDRADTFRSATGMPYDPDKIAALVYLQYVNVARQDIRGVDVSGTYRTDLALGSLTLRGSASWLDSSQQTIPGQAAYDLSGTLFSPAKLNARLGGVWKRGGFSGSTFFNHSSGVTNRLDAVKSASFTTMDLSLRYATDRQGGVLAGSEVALAVDNVLNRDPPQYQVTAPLYVAPYDSSNYSPIGRFVSLSVAKHW